MQKVWPTPSISAPSDPMQGWLYDGVTAVRRTVRVERDGSGWRLLLEEGDAESLDPSRLQPVETRGETEIYGWKDRPGWRLGLYKPLDPDFAAALPRMTIYGRWIDRIGLWRAAGIGIAASAALLLLVNRLPDLLAPLVPFSWEQKYGDALLGDADARLCAAPTGQKALDAMAARLSPSAGHYKVRVADIPIVNAVALPGGNIVIFKALLDEAEGPDEVAGVLGHEIAHVENRDVTRALIRQYGFSLSLSALGGPVGGNIETLSAARYSREAEARADGGSIAALARARISPLPTARFFERLAAAEKGAGGLAEPLAYLGSHPLSETRRQRFVASARKGAAYRPALSAQEWLQLREICATPRKK
ncbi:MAG TPA: M48 family metallopeptidase [Allosphingosinicella sp.]